jgi:predicted oxidoreductase
MAAHNVYPVQLVVCVCLASMLYACHRGPIDDDDDADVIIVGAGISGLSAALEMGARGVEVLVVDMNSVAGGHAVMAGGVAIVDSPLQQSLSINDSADLAYRDWIEWTEDGDAEWTREYVDHSSEMIYDWLAAMGAEFVRVAPGHGNSVPRFHFTQGRAIYLVLPMFRKALGMLNVSFVWNAYAERLLVEDGRIQGVEVKDLRGGESRTLRAANVVLATGGFESDLDRVLANWSPDLPKPDRLLIGSAISATGSGHDMATSVGASLVGIDRHYIYIDGMVDPRDPEKSHALTASNEQSMWVNAQAKRFTNERGFDKDILIDLLQQEPSSYWAIFDASSRDDFGMRGAAWLNNPMQGHPVLDDSQATVQAQSLQELGMATGLPVDALLQSVQRFNALIDSGEDEDFGRFGMGDETPNRIEQAPFHAVQMFPMTRKNMGGVAVDRQARALNAEGQVIPGLYAVGELNGSVGINGKHGLDGMFLGPAIFTGRLAGRSIADAYATQPQEPTVEFASPLPLSVSWQAGLDAAALNALLAEPRDGYWHFQKSHQLVLEREYSCERCHSAQLPLAPVSDRAGLYAQTAVCTNCH